MIKLVTTKSTTLKLTFKSVQTILSRHVNHSANSATNGTGASEEDEIAKLCNGILHFLKWIWVKSRFMNIT